MARNRNNQLVGAGVLLTGAYVTMLGVGYVLNEIPVVGGVLQEVFALSFTVSGFTIVPAPLVLGVATIYGGLIVINR